MVARFYSILGSSCSLASGFVHFSHSYFKFFVFEPGSVVCGQEALGVLFSSGLEHSQHLAGRFDVSEISCSCVVSTSLLEQHWSASTFVDSLFDYRVSLLLCVSAITPLFRCLLLNDAIRRLSKHRLECSLDAACKLLLACDSIRITLPASLFLLPLLKDLCSSFGLRQVHGPRARRIDLWGCLAPRCGSKLLLRLSHLICTTLSTLVDVGSVENLTGISGCPFG